MGKTIINRPVCVEALQAKNPTGKGQKYIFQNSAFTALSFIGSDGIEYDTMVELKRNRPNDRYYCVKNKEYNGISIVDQCTLINSEL